MVGAIVAVGADNIIGVGGSLPWHYSEDLKRFKRITMGSSIIMGRKTFDSINRRQLPGRRSLVISRQTIDEVEHFTTIEDALRAAGEPAWVIGGAQIYALAMPYLDVIDMTIVPDRIDAPNAVRFPAIDEKEWRIVESLRNTEDPRIEHRRLERIKPPLNP
ncbi:MAG: dihydrofolate reductase [marine bacterium B5-7]|nr:MAG: dihydrofolate reductase [marine bacterium B5-7]